MRDDPDLDTDLPDDTQFSVVLRSYGAPIVATVDQLQGVGTSTEALSYTGFASGATTVYLPNVTRRFYGYDVPFIVQNLGATAALVSARFISFDGTQTLSVSRIIEPGRSRVIDPDSDDAALGAPGLMDGTQYAVTLRSNQPIAVVANAENKAVGPVAYSHSGLAAGATTLFAPYAVKSPNASFSPVVVQNVGTTPTDATLTFAPLTGSVAPQSFTLRSIPAGGGRAFDPRFTLGTTTPCAIAGPTCLGPGEYSLKIQSAQPIAAVVLPNSSTTAAAYLAATTLQPRSLLPVVARTVGGPGGPSTTIFVQPGTSTRATLRYYALANGALVTTQELALPPNGAKVDVRAVPGLADNARYSVTIDGGGGTLVAVAQEQAATGGDASMMYEGFGSASLPVTPQPGSVQVTTRNDVVIAGASEAFSAVVDDQFGVGLPSTVTWSVTPAGLGAISPSGIFTAGPVGGTGAVSATVGGITTSAAISVQTPARMTLSGLSFNAVTASTFDLYSEGTITVADMQRIFDSGVSDIGQIQNDYAFTYTHRPRVYVLATPTTFSQAVQAIGPALAPPTWAAGVCACDGDHNRVFLNWQSASAEEPMTDLRHELTHAMEHDRVIDGELPAWVNEGNARLEELTLAGAEWLGVRERYRAASMAAHGALFTLAQLTSQATWNARSEADAPYQYAVASQAVALLRSDIGMGRELALMGSMADGASFEDAYAAVAGRPFSDFSNDFETRIRALAARYPGIATSTSTPGGPGLFFIFYGLPANVPFTLAITGSNGYRLASSPTRVADQYGVYVSYLGTGWPPGSYTISGSWAGGTVSTTAAKISTLDAPATAMGEPSGLGISSAPQ